MPFDIREYKDILVVPYFQARPNPLGMPVERGGPIWPLWEDRTFERHRRTKGPIDIEPRPEDAAAVDAGERAFWAGAICGHFGNQIGDFSMRILASRKIEPRARLVFTGKRGLKVPNWFFQILHWCGLSAEDYHIVQEPTFFKLLKVVPQQELIPATGPDGPYLDALDSFIGTKNLPRSGPPVLYVSRAGQPAHFAGELYLEQYLTENGVTVMRPETLPIAEQIATYVSSPHIIFPEGSAIHGCQLAGRQFRRVDILVRRHKDSGRSIFARSYLRPRAQQLRYVDALAGGIHATNIEGNRVIQRSAKACLYWIQRPCSTTSSLLGCERGRAGTRELMRLLSGQTSTTGLWRV
jgi:hypothetical protein